MNDIMTVETDQSNHFLKSHYSDVSEALADLGHENDLLGMVAAPNHVKGIPDGTAITPALSEPIDKMIENGQVPFELDSEIEGCFGGGKGSANVTTRFEETGMAIEEALEILDMTGQLDDFKKVIDAKRADTDPSTNDIMAYALATFSKGWRAERYLDRTDRWTTGSVSQDQGGLDLYDRELGEWVQLKPITVLASNGHRKFENKKQKHLFYMWDSEGNIQVTDTSSWKEMKNQESDKTGIPGTLLIKSEDLAGNEMDRRFRFLWW